MHQKGGLHGEVERRPSAATHKVDQLKKLGAKCNECPFFREGAFFKPVLPVVPANPYGVLIGESPGREECERGEPFVGSTGEALNAELLEAKLLRSKLVVINAICCLPLAKNVSVMGKAVAACRPVFLHYMRKVDPTLPVFAMGAWAAAAFTGKRKAIEKTRGFVRSVELYEEKEIVNENEEAED
jgi:uracil-DNA glycosylase family 4